MCREKKSKEQKIKGKIKRERDQMKEHFLFGERGAGRDTNIDQRT